MQVIASTVRNFSSNNFRDLNKSKIPIGSIIPVNWVLHGFCLKTKHTYIYFKGLMSLTTIDAIFKCIEHLFSTVFSSSIFI